MPEGEHDGPRWSEVDFVGFEKRPYGWKKMTGDHNQTILIEPGKDTSMAASRKDLDVNGLRGHPGILYEHTEYHANLMESLDKLYKVTNDNEYALLYSFRKGQASAVRTQKFAPGSKFYSVQTDLDHTGYWHTMKNLSSDKIVMLNTIWENTEKKSVRISLS